MAAANLDAYRTEAEEFVSALDREYYLQGAGLKDELEIEPIYERHAGLFSRAAVEELREAGNRELLQFAVQGLMGSETRGETAAIARLEAELELELDGERIPFRQSALEQANAADPARRAALDDARLELTEHELNPLLRAALERSHSLARELGWASYADMAGELSATDLTALSVRTRAFLEATAPGYRAAVEPRLRDELGLGFGELRRSDLPAFFRAPSLDRFFPDEQLLESYSTTKAALGLTGDGVLVDAEPRPKKSPRAFCAPVRVPEEVHLVIPRVGGREDYESLFHEAGHAEHYAHVDAGLPFEDRYLGDNSVTEGFAFLLQHLTSDAGWLRRHLGGEDPEAVAEHEAASKLVFLRRYSAKLDYELALHGPEAKLGDMPGAYALTLGDAVGVEWPAGSWLADVDPFFYAARYLRAWAFEVHLRRELRARFGESWWDEREAGALLVSLWRRGQRQNADELLAELSGEQLDFLVVAEELGLAAR